MKFYQIPPHLLKNMQAMFEKLPDIQSPLQTVDKKFLTYELSENVTHTLFTPEQIVEIVHNLGQRISKDYAGKDLLLVCVMRGAVHFFSDLCRAITIKHKIEFMQVKSYTGSLESGTLDLVHDLHHDTNTHVIIVDELCDTGKTFSKIAQTILCRGYLSVRTCALLDKPARRQVQFTPDYVGQAVGNHFVIGYGMDWQEYYRNLPFIGILKKEAIGK